MTNPRAAAAYLRASEAFRNPTLDLLHGRFAPFVVTALSLVFTPDRPAVTVTDAHMEVGDIARELRDSGFEGVPAGNGREICRYWVRVGWIVPRIRHAGSGTVAAAPSGAGGVHGTGGGREVPYTLTTPGSGQSGRIAAAADASEGVEEYRLSAQAVGALEIAGRAGGGRARVTRSRVRTLLDSVERLVADAETDPQKRIGNLRRQRDQIDAEIKALREGGGDPVDDDQLLEEVENVLHQARELPADFVRVAESITAMQRDVVTDLRRDVRPTGEVLRGYLHRGQHVMEGTPEGRAFAGALKLIGDPEQIDLLTDQLHSLLSAPFARALSPEQRRDLAAVAGRVEQGVSEVLAAQRQASHVITAQVRVHDPLRDREVDDLLRSVMSGLQSWMRDDPSAGGHVDPLRRFPATAVGNLRRTLGDPGPSAGPAPLRSAEDVPDLDVDSVAEDARAWGGPRYDELEETVSGLGRDGETHFDLASLFSGWPGDARRPVDLLGLLEIAHRNGMVETDEVSVVEARRPDGTVRRFAFGGVTGSTSPDEQESSDRNQDRNQDPKQEGQHQ
ncbi:hypothetical protein Csp1_09330 [Corynebacterium provencense]|uniref:DUF3375 domain-containing protein n=1 Tax=Corynebacterium provencense TaxID=1737425 RepID=A0A2Z3YP60_9CORY|nr:DUF3375 domain-containing protein [Corynebacterium provencense]AWT25739.1 hypothetical protein Csp1_09330 [Corynebacterium provencense]